MSRPTSELAHLFRALKAPAAARALPKLADRAREEQWSYEQFAATLLKTETDSRDSHGGQARSRTTFSRPARKSSWPRCRTASRRMEAWKAKSSLRGAHRDPTRGSVFHRRKGVSFTGLDSGGRQPKRSGDGASLTGLGAFVHGAHLAPSSQPLARVGGARRTQCSHP